MTNAPYHKYVTRDPITKDYALYLNRALVAFAPSYPAGQQRLNELVYDLLTKGPRERHATMQQLVADAQAETSRRHHRQAVTILKLAGTAKRLSVAVPRPSRPTNRYGAALWTRLADGLAAELALRQARQQPQATWETIPLDWRPSAPALGLAQIPVGIAATFGGGLIYAWGLEPSLQRFLDTLADYLMLGIATTRQADGRVVQHLDAEQAERAWVAAVLATYPTVPASLTTVPWWPDAPLHIAAGLARLIGPPWQVDADGLSVSRTIPAPDAQGWITGSPATPSRIAA